MEASTDDRLRLLRQELTELEGLFRYAAIGTVTNLAAHLSDAAAGNQILISARVHAAVEHRIQSEPVGPLPLKGFARPVPAFNVLGRRD